MSLPFVVASSSLSVSSSIFSFVSSTAPRRNNKPWEPAPAGTSALCISASPRLPRGGSSVRLRQAGYELPMIGPGPQRRDGTLFVGSSRPRAHPAVIRLERLAPMTTCCCRCRGSLSAASPAAVPATDSPRLCTGETMAVAAQRFSSTPKCGQPATPGSLGGPGSSRKSPPYIGPSVHPVARFWSKNRGCALCNTPRNVG